MANGKGPSFSLVAQGLAAPEGPVVLSDGRLACVEMAADRLCVTRIAADGAREPVVTTGGRPNGLAIDGDGRFWVAGGPHRAIGCYAADGRHLTSFDSGDTPLLYPNDLAFGPDNALYVTDSGWLFDDLSRDGRPRPDFFDLPFAGAVVRIDPVTRKATRLAEGIRFANGLAFDPAGALFVNESLTGMIYRVDAGGVLTPYANVAEDASGGRFVGPDGMAFATDGTLYCAVYGAGDVAVVPPGGGKVAARLRTPGNRPSNVAFARNGAPGIYVTEVERGEMLRLAVDTPGLPLHEPRIGDLR